MHHWPETNESLILRVKDPADAASWSQFLAIYRLAAALPSGDGSYGFQFGNRISENFLCDCVISVSG